MSLDSAANLLFTIGADSSNAEANIQRFRTLMGQDLETIRGQFSDWSTSIFGDLSTMGGMFTALSATIAAGAVVAAAGLVAAAEKASDYAMEIGNASVRTGIAAEDMSRLRYAAEVTHTSYDSLVTGLTRFASTIDAARDPSSKQAEWFHRIGVSQEEIAAGSKNMLPLLYQVADAFSRDMTATERTAMARELFARGGAGLVEMLSKGSGALKEFGDEADKIGKTMSTADVQAAREWKAEVGFLKAELEGMELEVGTHFVPFLTKLAIGMEAIGAGIKKNFTGGVWGGLTGESFAEGFEQSMYASIDRMQAHTKAAMQSTTGLEAPGADKGTKEATQDYYGLSNILESVRLRFASASEEETKLAAETAHLNEQVAKAQMELVKLGGAAKLAPETVQREIAALAQLPAQIDELTRKQRQKYLDDKYTAELKEQGREREQQDKYDAEVLSATDDLQHRLAEQQEKGYAQEVAGWETEIRKLRDHLSQKALLTDQNEKLLESILEAGRRRLANQQMESFVAELRSLQQYLAQAVQANFTSRERIEWGYQQDLEKFSEVEKAKALRLAEGIGQRMAIEVQFDLNRAAALKKYQNELEALHNSTGWRGVFGNEFANAIKGNEALLREWATSSNQSLLMVKVATEALKESAQQAFGSFSQAMGQNIAQAIVYKGSIADAMRAAMASTLESLAAQAITYAIYATGLGFLRIAEHDYAGAASAFTAAAEFGAMGIGAALAGRAIAPKQAASGASGGASGGGTSSSASTSVSTSSSTQQGPSVHVYVSGPIVGVSGIEELTDMINDAVKNRDVRLIATQVRQTTRATQ